VRSGCREPRTQGPECAGGRRTSLGFL